MFLGLIGTVAELIAVSLMFKILFY